MASKVPGVAMPISNSEARALNDRIAAELLKIEPPFFGINVIRLDNLAAFATRMQPVRRQFDDVIRGFRSHFRAVIDDGSEKRMLAVNLYGPDLDRDKMQQVLADAQLIDNMIAAIEVVNEWDFFVAREV